MNRSETDGNEREGEGPAEQKLKERLALEEAKHTTEHKQREERMKRLNAGLLSLGHDYHRNIQILAALCGELLDADCALYNRLDGDLLCVKGQWNAPADLRREDSPGGHLCFDVIRHNIDQPLVVRNLEDTPYAKTDPNVAAYGLRTYIGYPVRFGGVTRGSLCVVYTRDYQPGADELDIIGFLAAAVAQEEERAVAAEALRRSEEFTRSILDNVNEDILLIDRDYRILTANRSYCAWAGVSLSEVVGKHCYAVSRGSSRPCYEQGLDCAVRRAFETGGHHSVLRKFEDTSGKSAFVEKRAFPVKDLGGTVISVIETIHDVTERHLLAEERLRTQKLEAIGTLAGGIAHDFNNLLQGVFGYMSMAKMNLDRREKAAAMLEQAEKALGMSVNLATQLLTFAKGGRPVKKCIALLPVIENAAKFALSGSSSDCRIHIEEGLWCVEADEGQMGQVIQNIVLNASEAMPGGGTVTISAGNMDIPAGEKPSMPEGGKFVRIVIEDKGIGIPEKYLTQIFDPYFTTKQKGSGLGLATSYSIIRNHGGVIDVASAADRGTTFSIYVPTCAPEAAITQPAASAGQRAGRVLIMDDEEMVRLVATEMLEALGHDAEAARDGDEAIVRFLDARKSGKPFDVVILDLTVKGGMGGEHTVRKIQEIDPGVLAVVSSGYADNPVVAGFRSHGFAAFLNKPYRIDALRDCLSALLARP
ncbi:MAG: ATP-binding protein [Nitrospiraceae bacterium]|nr:ATP-binding protein [Nitrospiraceae bacterium]